VSFRGARRRDFGDIRRPEPLVFIDLDSDDVEVLRSIPAAFANQRHGMLLVRVRQLEGPAVGLREDLRKLAEKWGISLRAAVLEQPVAEAPRIVDLDGETVPSAEYLIRARAIELEALLEFGQAIWRPTTYHYRLITGEHAPAYIKLGDAIRGPRDADVLASWMRQHVGDSVGLIIDTGTLTPIAQSLRLAVAKSGGSLGPVSVLDQHPRTGTDIDSAIDTAAGDAGRLLVVISISSSGSLVERVTSALHRKGGSLTDPRIAVLVDKSGPHAAGSNLEVWTPLPGQEPLVEVGARDDIGCLLCREPGRAPVVPINPFSFDALPTQLHLVVPDTRDPMDNRPLWEAAKRTKAVAVERAAHVAVRRHRSDKVPMGIVLILERLISDATLRAQLIERIRYLQTNEGLTTGADLVLMAKHECGSDTFDQFWDEIGPVLAPDAGLPVPFNPSGDFGKELVTAIRDSQSLMLFGLGTVSGASLQRALVGVQDGRKGMPDFELQGFVMHARPATRREWATIENSFGRTGTQSNLHYAWKSILPDRSPLREEGALLRTLDLSEDSFLSGAAVSFVEERLRLCQREITQDELDVEDPESLLGRGLLWGTVAAEDRLTPNSLYGQDLDAVTTYVAVGSAMAAALAKPGATVPELHVFEVAAMARSYYDPIILSCFLRWLRPHETFWGWSATQAKTTALHIIDRAEGKHQKLLVPEMLLATAQGKLTAEAAEVIADVAQDLVDKDGFEDVRPALQTGLALISAAPDPPATEGLPGSSGS
jgi:hypothetical protein